MKQIFISNAQKEFERERSAIKRMIETAKSPPAHAMYYAKYIEELGTGITELLKKCREHGLKRPLVEESSGKFRIILWRRANAKVGSADLLRFELLVVEYLKTVGEMEPSFLTCNNLLELCRVVRANLH